SLADLSRRHLDHNPVPRTRLTGEGKLTRRLVAVDTPEMAQHFGEESDIAWRLCEQLEKELVDAQLQKVYQELEIPLIPVLMEMEETGITLHVDLLRELSREYTAEARALEEEIYRLAGRRFNVDSPIQLREILFVELKLPKGKKTAQTGEASTNQEVLEALAAEGYELPNKIIAYRQRTKLQSTYLDALPAQVDMQTGRLHCQFNQTVAATGRLSSSNPNLQNIPMRTDQGRIIRKAFEAGPGYTLITADYSQIELRIFAHLSEDAALLHAFREHRDIHSFVAAQVFGIEEKEVTSEQRRLAKVVNFGVLYGLSPY
ncbi:MAG TPA: DNA polymerase, partial [Gemmatales bacterium]|nr:DNA polymerase [Gemmatales bacterium]